MKNIGWFVSRFSTQDGPFSSTQLKELAITNNRDDAIYITGNSSSHKVAEFFDTDWAA